MKIRSLAVLGLEPFAALLRNVALRRGAMLAHSSDAGEIMRQVSAGVVFDLSIVDAAVPNLEQILAAFHKHSPETTVALAGKSVSSGAAFKDEVFAIFSHALTEAALELLADAVEQHRDRINETAYYRSQESKFAEEVVGNSEQLKALVRELNELARPLNAEGGGAGGHVLLSGPSGCGKTFLARVLHRRSARPVTYGSGALVTANCHALPGLMLERKLFFCRPSNACWGAGGGLREPFGKLWDIAAGGSLHLDRIECMSEAVQEWLARKLEEQAELVDGESVDSRGPQRLLLASRLTREELKARGFNVKLLDRLVQLHVPPLRERPGDIALLAESFLREFGELHGRIGALSGDARALLRQHDWPDNIRELKACMERALYLARDGVVGGQHLGLQISDCRFQIERQEDSNLIAVQSESCNLKSETHSPPSTVHPFEGRTLDEIESVMIKNTMQQTGGNRTQAARLLDISVRTLYTKLIDIERREKLARCPPPAGRKQAEGLFLVLGS